MATKKIKANTRFFKGHAYTYSASRECWKIYHKGGPSYTLMDFSSEAALKKTISTIDANAPKKTLKRSAKRAM